MWSPVDEKRGDGAMKPVLLTDFGSTYTKLTAVDLDAAELLGTASRLYDGRRRMCGSAFSQGAGRAACAKTGALTFAAAVCLLLRGGRPADDGLADLCRS